MSLVLGLTGSIGMGKSATADMFRKTGVPVHDADAAVHALYAGAAAPLIEQAFPGTTRNGVVDRPLLGQRVLGNPAALKTLEQLVHPLVRETEAAFLRAHQNATVTVLDIPLLLETGGEGRCDAIVVVTAPAHVQRERVLARPGMTAERFNQIMSRQMPDAEKRRRSHFLVDSSRGFAAAERAVRDILRALAGRSQGRAETTRQADHA